MVIGGVGGVGGVVVVVVGGGVLVLVDCFLNGPHPCVVWCVGVLVSLWFVP